MTSLPGAMLQSIYLLEARTFWTRWRGLKALPQTNGCVAAVWLRPCFAVHLWGMTQPLDICFLDDRDQPLRFCPSLSPGRVCWLMRARSVLEAPAGSLSRPEQFAPWAAAMQQLRRSGGGVWMNRP